MKWGHDDRVVVQLRAPQPSRNGAPVVLRAIPELRPRRDPRGRLAAAAAVLALVCAFAAGVVYGRTAEASEPPPWIGEVIQDRAAAHGASSWALTVILRCESGFDPGAVGDRGRSHGIAQINDHPRTGLLGHFRSLGYSSPYSAWESIDYLARVLAGEFRWANVAPSRWTCARLWGIW